MPGGTKFSRLSAIALFAAIGLAAPASGSAPAVASAPPAETGQAAAPRPALWLLADADTRIYLFGTFHILPPGFRWRSPAIDAAIRDADELVVEVSEGDAAVAEAMAAGVRLGKSAPVLWRVSPDRREALREMIEATGLPIETFDGMHSWAVALTIAALSIVQDYSAGHDAPLTLADMPGVEDVLETAFRDSRRPISGVETAIQQMGFFGSLSFAEQRALLESMVDDYRAGETGQDLDENEWVRGNVEAIAIAAGEMPAPLYDALITRRNIAWSEWLAARLERPGTILFAVGAGHLAGRDSVQAMLARRGLNATRID